MAIELISKIKPKNNGTFPMVDAADVELANGARLEAFLQDATEILENLQKGVLPDVSTEDNNKVLQVVNGVWSVVTIAESSIKTYIDEYISEALGGEY